MLSIHTHLLQHMRSGQAMRAAAAVEEIFVDAEIHSVPRLALMLWGSMPGHKTN